MTEVGFDVAALAVELFDAETRSHGKRLNLRPEAAPGVALLFGAVEVPVVARQFAKGGRNVRFVRLQFLYAEAVRVLFGKPSEKALVGGGTYAVGIEGNDAVHVDSVNPRLGHPVASVGTAKTCGV